LSPISTCHLGTLTPDPPSQLDILGHDSDTLGMDGTKVSVLEQTDKVCLSCLLQRQHSMALETQISLHSTNAIITIKTSLSLIKKNH